MYIAKKRLLCPKGSVFLANRCVNHGAAVADVPESAVRQVDAAVGLRVHAAAVEGEVERGAVEPLRVEGAGELQADPRATAIVVLAGDEA